VVQVERELVLEVGLELLRVATPEVGVEQALTALMKMVQAVVLEQALMVLMEMAQAVELAPMELTVDTVGKKDQMDGTALLTHGPTAQNRKVDGKTEAEDLLNSANTSSRITFSLVLPHRAGANTRARRTVATLKKTTILSPGLNAIKRDAMISESFLSRKSTLNSKTKSKFQSGPLTVGLLFHVTPPHSSLE
jgi:hypothetical protein